MVTRTKPASSKKKRVKVSKLGVKKETIRNLTNDESKGIKGGVLTALCLSRTSNPAVTARCVAG